MWNRVGGFSEEFFPGTGSDPDLNMKLMEYKVCVFLKVWLMMFKVFHFGSVVTRRNHDDITQRLKQNQVTRVIKYFLLKWGIFY